ncbi:MAG: hypothetical protein U1F50_13320 [Rubrivivax sp.]
MSKASIEKLIWVLIYGGLLAVCLAIFVAPRSVHMGWLLGVAGGVAVAAGVALVVVRSRL